MWLSWPRNPATWPEHFEPVPGEFAQFVRLLAEYEPVNILAGGKEVLEQARVARRRSAERHAARHSHQRRLVPRSRADVSWQARGQRPEVSVDLATLNPRSSASSPALVDWEYNAWGGKYPPFDLDNQVPRRIAELQGRRVFTPGIILEGGAIDGNGCGTILTTESCLLNPNRNPQLARDERRSAISATTWREERSSGSPAARSPATTPTATSTRSPGS